MNYNGTELPALPQWNKSAYPYAFIAEKSSGTYFYTCDKHCYVEVYANGFGYTLGGDLISDNDDKTIFYNEWVLTDGEWVQEKENTYSIVISVGSFVWSNHDILKEDGTICIEASDPFYPQGFLNFLAAGLCCKGTIAPAQKEPVAYLYNGVRLPKLPEWDKETYPYGALINPVTDTTQIRFVASEREKRMLGNGVVAFNLYTYISFLFKDGEWVKLGDGVTVGVPFWCSYDIYYNYDVEDLAGTLYLAASDPIPVYE